MKFPPQLIKPDTIVEWTKDKLLVPAMTELVCIKINSCRSRRSQIFLRVWIRLARQGRAQGTLQPLNRLFRIGQTPDVPLARDTKLIP